MAENVKSINCGMFLWNFFFALVVLAVAIFVTILDSLLIVITGFIMIAAVFWAGISLMCYLLCLLLNK